MNPFARVFVTCAAVLVSTSLPAAARSCSIEGNLVLNCGFDDDLAGWNFTTDLPTWVADDCATGPGCVTLERWDFAGAIEAIGTCMDVPPATYWAFGGSSRFDSGNASSGCFFSVVQSSNDDCSVFLSETFFARRVDMTWREQMGGLQLVGEAQSVQLKLACFSAVEFVLRIDDFFFLPAVFVDGFEVGSSAAWSSSVP